jgi:hypothetical protein
MRTVMLVAAAAAPWAAWYLATTGVPYPSTIGAKRAFFAESEWPLSGKVQTAGQGLAHFAAGLGALGVGIAGLWRSRLGRLILGLMALFVVAYTIELPSALGQYDARYLHPLIPAFVLGVAVLAERRRSFGAVVIAVAIAQNLWALPARVAERREWTSVTSQELVPLAAWLRTHVDKGEPLLIHDAGYLSEATPFRLVDMVGLKTPQSVAAHREFTEPSRGAGRARAVAAIATRAGTRYMVLTPRFVPDLVDDMRRLGWTLTLVYEVRHHPIVFYQVYRIVPPNASSATGHPSP